ncbi:hypothetical protein BCR34DRAFT_604371 [Clohesyomyces aquaticus]|uniref:Zn(2)-C6 fungal-type domain-containing protein n=1 Tax=Clohesyomyces aquaticus TaxID=1231657 RepID=A0A1Y1Z7E0_9PLEO|nr:hypothetical protein BCR34DRAFT_604371 [Clohesyomyces aquaticus]
MDFEPSPQHHPFLYWHPQNTHQYLANYREYSFQSPLQVHETLPSSPVKANGSPSTVSIPEPVIRNGSKKRRACNECKQQKLKCDLSTLADQHPRNTCSRCKRLGLECRIDRSFRRERKRKRSDELEKEVDSLKKELSRQSTSAHATDDVTPSIHATASSDTSSMNPIRLLTGKSGMFSTGLPTRTSSVTTPNLGSLEVITRPFPESPRIVRDSDVPGYFARASRFLDDFHLSADDIDELFALYFMYYHPFLPVLDPTTSPGQYYHASPLLFWAIISVASRRYDNDPNLLSKLARSVTNLTWRTLQYVPHSKHVVQSLMLFCTWPFPTSSNTTDVSYMWMGTMMQIAVQLGLHRPLNPDNFTKCRVRFTELEIADRLRTWAGCNIVAQSVSVGSGLAAPVQYDWSLVSGSCSDSLAMILDRDLDLHLRTEMFRDNVSRAIASCVSDPVGLVPTHERLSLYKVFSKELEEIESIGSEVSDINRFYISAARLHLQSFALFDEPSSDSYINRILSLYYMAASLIQQTLDADRASSSMIRCCPFFVYQTFVSASFIVLKVLKNNYFSSFIDIQSGRTLFHASITAIRRMSLECNDLPARLGDVLGYLWSDATPNLVSRPGKGGLQLQIRSRMSMSVVYDSLWRWREQVREQLSTDHLGIEHEHENLGVYRGPARSPLYPGFGAV